MGISDRHHFGWLTGALARFERETGRLGAIGRAGGEPVLWGLGARHVDPVLAYVAETLESRTRVALFDRFPEGAPGVRALDINALESLPDDACDVLAVFRASYFIAEPATFLAQAHRVLRPGGLAIIDWLHGLSDAPVLDLRGDPRYGGGSTPFTTTYCDSQFLADFAPEFGALIRHVNRPPASADVERPGARVPWRAWIARALGGGPRRRVALATYLDVCRADLARANKQLIEPPLMEQYFKVMFRHARYFYPHVGKFNLYLLTVLEPVGK